MPIEKDLLWQALRKGVLVTFLAVVILLLALMAFVIVIAGAMFTTYYIGDWASLVWVAIVDLAIVFIGSVAFIYQMLKEDRDFYK